MGAETDARERHDIHQSIDPRPFPKHISMHTSTALHVPTCMMKFTSCAVGCGVMVVSDCESVVPARVQPSQGRKKSTLHCG